MWYQRGAEIRGTESKEHNGKQHKSEECNSRANTEQSRTEALELCQKPARKHIWCQYGGAVDEWLCTNTV